MIRTVLLAACLSAAPLVAAAAGERPAPEPARVCPRHGPGFVQIPGSSTCIRIDGRVRAEAGASTRQVGRDRAAGFGSSAQVAADTRTDTDYGPVRGYVRVRAGSATGR